MEENKELLNGAEELAAEESAAPEEKKEKKAKKEKKGNFISGITARIKAARGKKLKNQALLKRGGFAVAITALVLVGIIVVNILVSALADRFNLEFDMSAAKINTISEENIDYIKGLEDEINVIVCSAEDTYASYMSYYAQAYNASGDTAYFEQTVNLINKYADYNDKITVTYVDPQTSEFTEISSKYSSLELAYGDIIVSVMHGDTERSKKVGFEDVYELTDESGYAAYGYGSYTVGGNNIETALTGAIAYAVSSETKKAALITGHSASDNTSGYVSLLEANNYEIVTVSDSMISAVPEDCDIAVIIAPSADFVSSELDAISSFLDNNGQLDKGLLYFADAACPVLPNLYEFLAQWGISMGDGILFETNTSNHITDDPFTMGTYPGTDSITDGMNYCITGYNVPITTGTPAEETVTVTELMQTLESVAVAPVGSAATWSDYTDADLGQYASVIEAVKKDYNDDNEEIMSYVMAFSSVEFVQSDWAEYSDISNKNIALAVTDRVAQVGDSGISFVSKVISEESYADQVTEAGSLTIRIIFMIALPIITIAAGIYIFIRRKNA